MTPWLSPGEPRAGGCRNESMLLALQPFLSPNRETILEERRAKDL